MKRRHSSRAYRPFQWPSLRGGVGGGLPLCLGMSASGSRGVSTTHPPRHTPWTPPTYTHLDIPCGHTPPPLPPLSPPPFPHTSSPFTNPPPWVNLSICNNFKIFVPFESICRMLEFLPLLPSPKIDWPLPSVVNILATILFLLECYHFIGHVCVLFRGRLLPRKDVVRIRYYFLFDTLTVFTVCFLYTEKLRWLAAMQMVQHLFFFFTWNRQSFTNRVSYSRSRCISLQI